LKTWFTLKVYGTKALGATIAHTCELARYLENRIAEEPELELMAPVELNIVCFRFRSMLSAVIGEEESDRINREIVIQLQESGSVAPSSTTLDGKFCIRAAIVNHRTSRTEIYILIEQTLALGRALQSSALSNRAVDQNKVRR
jgi:aromatic-L-amino-acid decarboxylase